MAPQGDSSPLSSNKGTVTTTPSADEQKKHQRFIIPKLPKRKKERLERKRRRSDYKNNLAREALGLEANTNHMQVVSAAVASTIRPVETPFVNSPTKDKVEAENKILKDGAATYKHMIQTLQLMNKPSKRMSMRLEVQVHSLSDSLKIKKKISRVAIKQLLTVTTMQHNELVAKFQDKIQDIHIEHDRTICRLQGRGSKEILDN